MWLGSRNQEPPVHGKNRQFSVALTLPPETSCPNTPEKPWWGAQGADGAPGPSPREAGPTPTPAGNDFYPNVSGEEQQMKLPPRETTKTTQIILK